jgi:predicted GNAT family N-acyltransferase
MKDLTIALFEGRENAAFADAAAVRRRVFLEEQKFPWDLDEMDERSVHLVFYCGATPVATARAFSEQDGGFHIGRVAVLRELRGRGLGARLMRSLEVALIERGATKLELGAQIDAVPFYEKLGYMPVGDVFDDAGAPHQMMQKRPQPM